jgi:hypothetical protein
VVVVVAWAVVQVLQDLVANVYALIADTVKHIREVFLAIPKNVLNVILR